MAAQKSTFYRKIVIDGDEGDAEFKKCAPGIAGIVKARDSMKAVDKGQGDAHFGSVSAEQANLSFDGGIFNFEGRQTPIMSFEKYIGHYRGLYRLIEDGPFLSVSRARLKALEERFELYSLLNTDIEEETDKKRRG
eukprot:PhF_6_TR29609/c0_g1_i2/m.43733